jgi:hypothetical protein
MTWEHFGHLKLQENQVCRLTRIIQTRFEKGNPRKFKLLDGSTKMQRLINAIFMKYYRPKVSLDVSLFWDLVFAAADSHVNRAWNESLEVCIEHISIIDARDIAAKDFWRSNNMNHQRAKQMLFARFPELSRC